jgi:hypothetical protein
MHYAAKPLKKISGVIIALCKVEYVLRKRPSNDPEKYNPVEQLTMSRSQEKHRR